MNPTIFNGIVVPVLTIFDPRYKVDIDAQILLTRHALANGAHVLFILGSTGEGQFIQAEHPEERQKMIRATKNAMELHGSKVPVIAGIFGNRPVEVVDQYNMLTGIDQESIIDGYVISPPLDVKLSESELLDYLSSIIQEISHPVFLYNNTSRFGSNSTTLEVYARLLNQENLFGIKDSNKDVNFKIATIKMLDDIGSNVAFYTGSEGDFFQCLVTRPPERAKSIGCIPSIGNVLNLSARTWNEYISGKVDEARRLQDLTNEIRNKFYHEPARPGKAQRGLKQALAFTYPNTALDKPPVVSPEYQLEIQDEAKQLIARVTSDAIANGHAVKVTMR